MTGAAGGRVDGRAGATAPGSGTPADGVGTTADGEGTTVAAKPVVGIEPFDALDLRVGRIVHVDPFPEARRPAWRLTVDLGPDLGVKRSSAQLTRYPADELVGRQVVCAVNLGVRRIAGFASEVLVLAALEQDGTPRLLAPDVEVLPGTVVA